MKTGRTACPMAARHFVLAAIGGLVALASFSNACAQTRAETLRVVTGASINTLDASMSAATRESYGISWNVYDRLATWETRKLGAGEVFDFNRMKGELAESWEVSADGRVITFRLRKDAVFHDGTPVTTEDVKWSLDRVLAQKGPAGQMATGSLTRPEQFEIVDRHTLRVTMERADRLALPNLGVVFPVIINSKLARSKAAPDDPWATKWLAENAAASGAYAVESWKPGEHIVLRRFDGWKGGPLPYFRRIIVQHVPEAATRKTLVEKGDADLATDLNPNDVMELERGGRVKVVSVPQINGFSFVAFNSRVPPYDNVKVRQALSYALPYSDMFKGAVFSRGVPLYGRKDSLPIRPEYPTPYPYETNLVKAKHLLAEAGHPNGFATTFSFNVTSASVAEPMAVLIKESLAKIGVQVEIQKLPDAQMATMVTEKKLPFFAESSFAWLPSPDYFFRIYYRGDWRWNFGSYSNAEFEKQIEEARWERDAKRYDQLVVSMVEAAFRDVPMMPLWQPAVDAVMAKEISGFTYWFHRQVDYRQLKRAR